MKATDLPRVAKSALPFESLTFSPPCAFWTIAVEPPPLNTVNIFAVFVVRGEGIDGSTFRIRNSPYSLQIVSANLGDATAADATAVAMAVVEVALDVDIVATATFVKLPASVSTDSIMLILLLIVVFAQFDVTPPIS